MLSLRNFSREDVGLYVCGASNEMNRDGDRVEGVVYLNMDPGNYTDNFNFISLGAETSSELARHNSHVSRLLWTWEEGGNKNNNHKYKPKNNLTTGNIEAGMETTRQGHCFK